MYFGSSNLASNPWMLVFIIYIIFNHVRYYTADQFINLAYIIPALLIAISFHEYAHAWAATKLRR